MCHKYLCARISWPILLSAIVLLATCSTARSEAITLHVALNGNDRWSGRLAAPANGDGPFFTFQRARDEIRKLKKQGGLPPGGVVVEVHGGDYFFSSPLVLTAEDSGAKGSPIVYESRRGETVRLVGGVEVKDFRPVTDPAVLKRLDASARGQVLQADLKAAGMKDLGQAVGANRPEVYFQDQPMTLARWPNEGFVHIVKLVGGEPEKIQGIAGDKIGRFIYDGDRPSRWTDEKDVWLHGYWFWDWSDQRQQVASIDTAKHMISLKPPYHAYGYRKGQWYYALNLLCELDTPGEWYLDRPSGILYFWPPAPLDHGKVLVSAAPSLLTMNAVSQVAICRLGFAACRGTAIVARQVDDVRIAGCDLRNLGGSAVSLSGKNSRVEGCEITNTDEGGISLSGGDRKTLTPANLAADNNHIHHYSRWNRMYHPAIALNGVGCRATHNLIHHAPHEAITFGGNDHLLEFNEIHHVCQESNDAGAIYAGRNWTMRGNVIRHNYLHDISGFRQRGCVGVYLDDQFSSAEIVGNLFCRVTSAAFIGGGRDCTIANNIFVDCKPALHIDARGLNWCAPELPRMKQSLEAMPYRGPLWAARYPKLVSILDDQPMAPKGDLIARNIFVGGRWDNIESQAKPFLKLQDNLIGQDPHFVDRQAGNFQLKADSPAYRIGFQRIPLEKIGLYESPERATWPVGPKP